VVVVECGSEQALERKGQIDGPAFVWLSKVGHNPGLGWFERLQFLASSSEKWQTKKKWK